MATITLKDIKARILSSQIVLIALVAVLIGFSAFFLMRKYLIDVQRDKMEFLARYGAETIHRNLLDREGVFTRIIQDKVIEVYSEKYNELMLAEHFSKFKDVFSTLSFVNGDGVEEVKVADGEKSERLNDLSGDALFQDSVRAPGKVFVSLQRTDPDVAPVLRFFSARRSYFGEFIGVVSGDLPLASVTRGIEDFRLGRTGFVILTDSEGNILFHPEKDNLLRRIAVRGEKAEEIISRATALQSGFGRATLMGVDGYVAYAPVGDMRWSLLVVMPYEEFMAGPNVLRNTIFVTSFLVLFVAVTLSLRIDNERRKAQEELLQSEKKYRALVDEVNDGIFAVDDKGVITFANSALARIHGLQDPEELLGRNFMEFLPAGLRAEMENELRSTAESGDVPEARELPIVRGDGRTALIEVRPAPVMDGGRVTGVRGVVRDITGRKEAEERLRQSEKTLQKVLDSLPCGVVIVGRDKKVRYLNQVALALTGHESEEQVVGKLCNEVFCPAEKDECPIIDLGQEIDNAERVLLTADGREIPVLKSVVPVELNGEEVLLETLIDITERREAEERLQKYADELRRSNGELEHFAYIASHDLQEPLRKIAGFTELLAKRYTGKLGPDADRFVAHVVDSTSRMRALINDLLSYSRITTRGKELSPVDLNPVLERVLSDMELAIKESGASVVSDTLPTVAADESQMGQVFQNLISNALKFRGAEQPMVRISAGRRDGDWVLSVRDNGMGFEPEYSERVFLMFQRLHARTEYPGTGIGLALCKKIIERHGGRIWVEPEPGKGSTFHFTIPAGPAGPARKDVKS